MLQCDFLKLPGFMPEFNSLEELWNFFDECSGTENAEKTPKYIESVKFMRPAGHEEDEQIYSFSSREEAYDILAANIKLDHILHVAKVRMGTGKAVYVTHLSVPENVEACSNG